MLACYGLHPHLGGATSDYRGQIWTLHINEFILEFSGKKKLEY